MNLFTGITITFSIFLSTCLISSTNHWLTTWMCLEINTFSMIPMISKMNKPRTTEAATKYFLTQTMASTVLLFATTMNAINTSNWEMHLLSKPMTTIVTLALLMKMAAAPLHFWLPEVSQGTTTLTSLIILTWQKIAPLMIMIIIHNKTNIPLLLTSATLSVIIGGLGGLNQTQLRKLMAFSSIAHTGWILTMITTTPSISTITFIIYSITTTPIFLMMNTAMATTVKDLGTLWTSSSHLMIILSTNTLSLSGMPPLTGFMPKWLILNKMIYFNMMAEAIIMAVASLLSLYFYMRLIYMSSMTITPHTTTTPLKWRTLHKKYPMTISFLTMSSILLFPLLPNM